MKPATIITAACPCGWRSLTYRRYHAAVKATDRHYAMYHKGAPMVVEFKREAAK